MSAKPTGKEIVKKVEVLKLKINALLSGVDSIQGAESVKQALSCHNAALAVKVTMDIITSDVNNVQQPVPLEDGQRVVEIAQGLLPAIGEIADGLTAKKALLGKMGVDNLRSMISQDIEEIQVAAKNMGNAMVENGPDDQGVKRQGRELTNEVDRICKRALVGLA